MKLAGCRKRRLNTKNDEICTLQYLSTLKIGLFRVALGPETPTPISGLSWERQPNYSLVFFFSEATAHSCFKWTVVRRLQYKSSFTKVSSNHPALKKKCLVSIADSPESTCLLSLEVRSTTFEQMKRVAEFFGKRFQENVQAASNVNRLLTKHDNSPTIVRFCLCLDLAVGIVLKTLQALPRYLHESRRILFRAL